MGLSAYLAVSALLFLIGLVMVASRRNLIYVLMGLELILNAANVNLVAFSRYGVGGIEGHAFAVMVIALAAAETVVALAIVLSIFHHYRTVDVDQVSRMKL